MSAILKGLLGLALAHEGRTFHENVHHRHASRSALR
jgi:hypothetical protein